MCECACLKAGTLFLYNVLIKPTLICEALNGPEEMEGEVLGGQGISMELLHRRLGHTSQGGMERLVREQLVRGLEVPLRLKTDTKVALKEWITVNEN